MGKIAYFWVALKQIFNLCHLIMKWRVDEINLRNFTLSLNENLYLPIFEKRIHSKNLQNSRMVLSILCNDGKICGNKLPELFQYKCISNLYCLIQFFFGEKPAGILGNLSSFSASHQLFVILLNGHSVFYEDRKQFSKVPWVRIASVIWQYYVLSVLVSTD